MWGILDPSRRGEERENQALPLEEEEVPRTQTLLLEEVKVKPRLCQGRREKGIKTLTWQERGRTQTLPRKKAV